MCSFSVLPRMWLTVSSAYSSMNQRSVFTHHTRSLHGLTQTGSIGLTPEHVADEISGAFGHDEGKGMYIFPHAHEWQEAHATLRQNLLGLRPQDKMEISSNAKIKAMYYRPNQITKIIGSRWVRVIILTSEIRIVRVAEATFTVTGLQSALSLEVSAVSKAELTMSMPESTARQKNRITILCKY